MVADLERILQLHQEMENNQAVDSHSKLPLHPVDLAMHYLTRKRDKIRNNLGSTPSYRTARIQEVTPRQKCEYCNSDKETIEHVSSNLDTKFFETVGAVSEKADKNSRLIFLIRVH